MNSRFIPISAFVLWSIFCWRWYVCDIKQVCESHAAAETAVTPIAETSTTTGIEDDTTGQASAINAIQPSGSNNGQAANPTASSTAQSSSTASTTATTQSSLSDDISTAQVVAVEDRVLIHFPYGSNRRVDDDVIDAYLSQLAASLRESGGRVSLTGHTDNIGDPKSNKSMSLQRAQHIKATLVKKGVSSSQVKVAGMGEAKPLATNDNPRGRYKNRRVEVRLK